MQVAVVVDDHGHPPGDGLTRRALVEREAVADPARDPVLGDLVVPAAGGVDQRDAAGHGAQQLAAVGEQAAQERADPQVRVHVGHCEAEREARHGRGDGGRAAVVDAHRSTIGAGPTVGNVVKRQPQVDLPKEVTACATGSVRACSTHPFRGVAPRAGPAHPAQQVRQHPTVCDGRVGVCHPGRCPVLPAGERTGQWWAARCAARTSRPKSAVGSRHTEWAWLAAALGVVPLDQQPRALQPVVVRRTGLGRARPGDVDGVEGLVVGVAADRGDPGGDAVEVGRQQRAQHLALAGVELGRRHALGGGGVLERGVVVVGVARRRRRWRR